MKARRLPILTFPPFRPPAAHGTARRCCQPRTRRQFRWERLFRSAFSARQPDERVLEARRARPRHQLPGRAQRRQPPMGQHGDAVSPARIANFAGSGFFAQPSPPASRTNASSKLAAPARAISSSVVPSAASRPWDGTAMLSAPHASPISLGAAFSLSLLRPPAGRTRPRSSPRPPSPSAPRSCPAPPAAHGTARRCGRPAARPRPDRWW